MGRVHQLALERLQARDVGPLPVIENSASIDEELGTVVEDFISDKVAHFEPPQPGFIVPLSVFDLVL